MAQVQRSGAVLHSSREPGELTQWLWVLFWRRLPQSEDKQEQQQQQKQQQDKYLGLFENLHWLIVWLSDWDDKWSATNIFL